MYLSSFNETIWIDSDIIALSNFTDLFNNTQYKTVGYLFFIDIWSNQNPNVFSVTFGDISEVDLNKTTIFPLSHLTITNVTFERSIINFNIALLCLDVVDYNKSNYKADNVSNDDIFNGNNNLQDIYNTQLQVVNDIVQSVRRGS